MKKLKLLPSVLMLIMCVGVLCVGVFAVSPIVSTIGGTLSISAAPGVKVAVYNSEGMSANSLVDSAFGGANTEVNLGEISLDSSTATTASDVTPKVFYIKLTTNQDNNYVVDTETIEYIDGVGVTSGEIIKNAGLVTKMHTYTATDGKGRACFNKTNPYTIKLSIKCGELSTEVVNMAFNLQLNIYEENDTNFTDTEINGVDYLYFGSYPQSLESRTVNGYTPTGVTFDEYYGYRDGSFQGQIYTKDGDSSNQKYFRSSRGGKCLYKIEPIRWDILKQGVFRDGESNLITNGNTMLVSDLILEFGSFGDGSNYKYSELRSVLTTFFYDIAFNNMEKDFINITTVQNDAASTGEQTNVYTCEDTEDMVFALSVKEITESNYAGSKNYTDFSQRDVPDPAYGSTSWLTRSPTSEGLVYYCCGYISSGPCSYPDFGGMVPAIHVSL